jgi:hypothetical protein
MIEKIIICLMNVFKSKMDCNHTPVSFFISIMRMKETLSINSCIKHLVFKGTIMDVVIMGLTFLPNTPTSLDVIVIVPMTLTSIVEVFPHQIAL